MRKTFRAAAMAPGASALAGFAPGARAAWVFYNAAAGDGSIPAGFTITGSDNGSGNDTSFCVQTFSASETLTFTWQYASLDTESTAYDTAGAGGLRAADARADAGRPRHAVRGGARPGEAARMTAPKGGPQRPLPAPRRTLRGVAARP